MNLLQGMAWAPEEKVAERLETCKACEFKGELPVVKIDICTVCGCPLANKTKFLNSNCPKGKW